jgi:hypothetical protein
MHERLKTFFGSLGLLAVPLSTAALAQQPAAGERTVASVAFMGSIGGAAIWMDLQVPSGDGAVTGTYFYLKHKKELKLAGTKHATSLLLEERYGGKVTGILKIQYPSSSTWQPKFPRDGQLYIDGTWSKPGKTATVSLSAIQSDPAHKVCAKLDIDQLLMTDGKSFGRTLEERPQATSVDSEIKEAATPSRDFEIAHCRNGLFSASYDYSYIWGGRIDPETPTAYQTFDLSTKQEISLAAQIAPDKSASFDAYVAKQFAGRGMAHSDQSFYLDDGTFMVGYSEFVPEDGAGNHTTGDFVEIPFKVLKKYLRKGSVLLRIAPNTR